MCVEVLVSGSVWVKVVKFIVDFWGKIVVVYCFIFEMFGFRFKFCLLLVVMVVKLVKLFIRFML